MYTYFCLALFFKFFALICKIFANFYFNLQILGKLFLQFAIKLLYQSYYDQNFRIV